ncbi:lipid storage droplets surface-binding protein 2 isoform X1 [Bactrocera neohumeralis]|uniref:lipid storage droplets surface-binding protein 2 isoform X1 n=1 Tax=Bactrocera tryoni TaxID=59916 RepID=UPI001A996325|nr:lipid storage droplets surface-binding protein 2 isoform X1 [Bactrocera tryoni]XP_050329817.1 lipid storage droplets surface-binding protein 2 isoform X1 [Bactrocera neohumeralis]
MAASANESKSTVAPANGTVAIEQAKDVQNLLPHLESLERIIKLPVVGAAWDKSQDVYQNVKGRNRVFNWALNAAEDCVSRAVVTAAPIVSKLDRPIQYVDQTLVKGIDKLEVSAPIIKDTPQEIYNQAKNKVVEVVQPHIERVTKFKTAGQQKAASLKDLAWAKANEVLATQYGSLAVSGVDTTTALAERLLEYYFPKSEGDVEEENDNKQIAVAQNGKHIENDIPVSATEDPVLHTVQTVGRLSHKISRRVYQNVSRQIKRMQKGNINDYLSSLIAALKLHQYINFINSSMGTNVEQSIADVSANSNNTNVATAAANNSNKTTPTTSTAVVAAPAAPTTPTTASSASPNASSATKRSNQNKSPNSTPPKAN